MPPYQNYYQNPMMYQPTYNNPMLNMQQRVPQQVEQPFIQQQPLSGRFVDAFETITANEVPMDGNGAVFIKRDGSEIQVRNWSANGAIQTIVFKPVLDAKNASMGNLSSEPQNLKIDLSDEATKAFMQRFDDIEKRIDDLAGKRTVRVKKEVDEA